MVHSLPRNVLVQNAVFVYVRAGVHAYVETFKPRLLKVCVTLKNDLRTIPIAWVYLILDRVRFLTCDWTVF